MPFVQTDVASRCCVHVAKTIELLLKFFLMFPRRFQLFLHSLATCIGRQTASIFASSPEDRPADRRSDSRFSRPGGRLPKLPLVGVSRLRQDLEDAVFGALLKNIPDPPNEAPAAARWSSIMGLVQNHQ